MKAAIKGFTAAVGIWTWWLGQLVVPAFGDIPDRNQDQEHIGALEDLNEVRGRYLSEAEAATK